jgi:hypothetical protein
MPALRLRWLFGLAVWVTVLCACLAEEPAAKEVAKTAFLNIRVVDEKGQPHTEAMVHLCLSRGRALIGDKADEPFRTFKCDEQGWATIGPFEPGAGYSGYALVQKERYAGFYKDFGALGLKAGRNEQVVSYTITVGGSVCGVLLDKDGRPLDGITVRFAPHSWCGKEIPHCGPMRCKPTCTTDARGAFFFEGLKGSGGYAVVAVNGFNVLYLGKSMQVPPAGKVDLGEIKTEIDRKDVKVGPD